jgi:hypothetical protein
MKSITSAVAIALVLSAAAARAQDEPPADLLSHVKVGQRYTFSTTIGEMVNEESWHVAEVHPDKVVYLSTTRIKQGERIVMEQVEQSFDEWTWGRTPVLEAAALAMSKGSQSRKPLEVSGMRFDCVVTLLAETESWTVVKGDLETFPGMVKAGVGAGREASILRALVRVEEGPPPTLPERAPEEQVEEGSGLPAGALDHVKVGQRWIFAQTMGGLRVDMTWTVTQVIAAEGRVLYKVKTKTTAEGTTTESEEEDGEWSSGNEPVLDPGTTVTGIRGERKVLELGARKLDCYVVHTNLEGITTEVWTAVKGNKEVFPGPVKQIIAGQGDLQLVRVE